MISKSSNWLFILSMSATAAAQSLSGCSENSSNSNDTASEETPCENDAYRCSGKSLEKCIENKWETQETCDSEASQ